MAHLGLLPRWRVPERSFGAVLGYEHRLARRADVSRSLDGRRSEFYDWGDARWTFRLRMLATESEMGEFLGPLSAADEVDEFDLDLRALPLLQPARFALFDGRPAGSRAGVSRFTIYPTWPAAPGFDFPAGTRRITGVNTWWTGTKDFIRPVRGAQEDSQILDLEYDPARLPVAGDFVRLGLFYAAPIQSSVSNIPPALPAAADSPYRNGWMSYDGSYDFGLYQITGVDPAAVPTWLEVNPPLRARWRALSQEPKLRPGLVRPHDLNYNVGFVALNAGVAECVTASDQQPFVDSSGRLTGSAVPGLIRARLARPVKIERDRSMLAYRADITIAEDYG